MNRNTICFVVVCHCLSLASITFGDVTPRGPQALAESATTIIVGRISNLEIKEEPGRDGFTDLGLYYTVDVAVVEKGQEHQAGDQVVVRAWRWKERNRDQLGNNGHRPLPAVGEEVRVFLKWTNVEFPNGFSPAGLLDTISDSQFFALQNAIRETDQYQKFLVDHIDPTPPTGGYSFWIAGTVVLIVVTCLVFLVRQRRQASSG